MFACTLLGSDAVRARQWRGPQDPDPLVVQVAAVTLDLLTPFDVSEATRLLMRPLDRSGQRIRLDPGFEARTGITEETLAARSMSMPEALRALDQLSGGGRLWSLGKDELPLMAIGSYVAQFAPLIPVGRFGNAATLLLKAGVPLTQPQDATGAALARAMDLSAIHPSQDGPDAATPLALGLQKMLRAGRLQAADFEPL